MKLKIFLAIAFFAAILSCTEDDPHFTENDDINASQGYNMLLMGNSFFKPYAEHLDVLASEAGFVNHNAHVFFRGGDNGRPINFWNDSGSAIHDDIKRTLDQGNIDILGMTAGVLPENLTDGFRQWIAYALQSNPDITVFLSIPSIDFPKDWNERATANGFSSIEELYTHFVDDIIHNTLVAQLRAEFPSIKIFTIPTGWATLTLADRQIQRTLQDDISLFGPKSTSIFTDDKGHQGQIVIETGTLVWLESIYKVDLNKNTYSTGFLTDLHDIAEAIMAEHDDAFKY